MALLGLAPLGSGISPGASLFGISSLFCEALYVHGLHVSHIMSVANAWSSRNKSVFQFGLIIGGIFIAFVLIQFMMRTLPSHACHVHSHLHSISLVCIFVT